MAYNQNYGGDRQDYGGYGDAGAYPQRQQPPQHDPFSNDYAAASSPNLYPPQPYQNDYANRSVDSLNSDNAPMNSSRGYGTGGGAAGGALTEKVPRGNDNPYAANYSGGSHVKRWIFIAVGIFLVAGAAAGIAAWRVNASKNASSSSSSDKDGTTSTSPTSGATLRYIDGTAMVVRSNPNDPSDFEKNDRFHQSFYGMCYTPFLAQEPWCGATQANVTEDIQQLSQLTTRIRMYGAACNQSSLVLQAIKDTKVNMTVFLGVYIGNNATVNEDQKATTLSVLETYGTDYVDGVTVGNEYILNQADQSAAIKFLTAEIHDFRTRLAALGLSKTLPVGTADAGSMITTKLAEGADYVMANVHPFFGGLPIAQAANWTWLYFEGNDVVATEAASNNPPAYVAETGWPSHSMTANNLTLGAAKAGVPELQTFLDTYPCTANTNGTMYFYFSPYDEPWKDQFGGVEPYWGLMDSNKILKDVTLPNCSSP